ncbi:zinc carboxypeptidase [bacterium]|nr:zinc carboxypeptidase [bacterium]
MKSLLKLFAVGCLLGASRFSAQPDLYYIQIPWKSSAQVQELVDRGFDVAGVNYETNQIAIVTDEVGVSQLRQGKGAEYARSQFMVTTAAAGAGYKHPDDIKGALDQIENDFPNLARVQNIGKSGDGRDIYAIQITDFLFIPKDEKSTVLFDAMHHARELMSPEVAIDIAQQLTSLYATDAQVRSWLKSTEIWVVPMVNPDGNDRVWTQDAGWRKNTRGGYGVDNNRNYPFDWGACMGSSMDRDAENYRGPSAGSEPETQALMKLAKDIQPVAGISYHSASEMVLYPYGCSNRQMASAPKAVFTSIASTMASKLVRDSGMGTYVYGTPPQLLYNADGGSMDWMYAQLGMIAFAIEISSLSQGFQPSYKQWRDSTVKRQRPGWRYLLERVQAGSIRARAATGTTVTVSLTNGTVAQKRKADSKGWAHFIVPAGNYKVSDGTTSKDITVADKRVSFSF